MSILRLSVCVVGVYAAFLLWAIAQERLSKIPFDSLDGSSSDKFKFPVFMGTCQSALSSVSAFLYIIARRKTGQTISQAVGLTPSPSNGLQNGHAESKRSMASIESASTRNALLLRFLQCALFITIAAPFGFAALGYISYPMMVLGKSCKLVPVMLMNIVLYRRKFAPHKYLVVAMVTAGISMFTLFSDSKRAAKEGVSRSMYEQALGLAYLIVNLVIDGATNSTQDEIFVRYKTSGQQMMLWINLFSTILTAILGGLPLPYIPVLHPSTDGASEVAGALAFIRSHRGVTTPLFSFALTGALGQLFIFETLQHFGSLTLVTITLTRKLFTMVLSVVVFNHQLTLGQWAGAAVVFAGISVEALVKRKDVHAKKIIQEKEKPKIKEL